MKPITVHVPQPGPWLATNDRQHWATRNRDTKAWREAAYWSARRLRPEAMPGCVVVHAVVHKRTHQLFDLDGITPTVKACIDGLRDARVLERDDSRRLVRFEIRDGGPDPGNPGITITITPERRCRP